MFIVQYIVNLMLRNNLIIRPCNVGCCTAVASPGFGV